MFDGIHSYKYLEGYEISLVVLVLQIQSWKLQPGGLIIISHFYYFIFIYFQVTPVLCYLDHQKVISLYRYSLISRYLSFHFLHILFCFFKTMLFHFSIEGQKLSVFSATWELVLISLFQITAIINQLLNNIIFVSVFS